jgi:hypothetical protein
MTVTNANYSSLDEVWGEPQSKPKRKDKKKEEPRKVPDPICELYEMGNYRGYTENDIVSYANEYLEKQNPIHRENYSEPDHVDVDLRDDDPIPPTPPSRPKREYVPPPREGPRHYYHDDEPKQFSDFAFIDLLLYVISGIILIFAMEQFVKIGVLLQ